MIETAKKQPTYFLLIILLTGGFIAYLNTTLMNVALPVFMKEFEISPSTAQWLVTIYMLISGVLIPTTAFFMEKYSVRKLFLIAMSLFTIGNLIGGFANSFIFLMLARVVQAFGASVLFPLIMNVMLTTFPVHKRGMAMGIYSIVMVFAPAIGPTLSGWILEQYNWKMLFFSLTPFAFFVLISAILILKDDKETNQNLKLDKPSILLSAIGFGGLLYGCSTAGDIGWKEPEVYVTLIIGAGGSTLFVLRQFMLKRPVLEFRIYKNKIYSLSAVTHAIVSITIFSGIILLPIYLQTYRGISPLQAGLIMIPGAVIMGIVSPIAGKLFDRYGVRTLGIIGISMTLLSTYAFSELTTVTSYHYIILWYSVRMFGLSLIMMPIITNGINQLPDHLSAHGTAMGNTLQQVSASIGSALLVTVMATRSQFHEAKLLLHQGDTVTDDLQMISNEASIQGLTDAFLVTTWIAAIGLILVFFLKSIRPIR